MYTLTFRDYLKLGHSLDGEIFGPAQVMHVMTYEVETTYITDALDEHGLIVDFGGAQSSLQEVLGVMNFKNLDEVDEFDGVNTTTEYLCKYIYDRMCERIADIFTGQLRVTLKESPVAWCSFEGPVPPNGDGSGDA